MNRPEFATKEKLRLAGISFSEAAECLGIPDIIFDAMLNGGAPLSDQNRKRIKALIQEHERAAVPAAESRAA